MSDFFGNLFSGGGKDDKKTPQPRTPKQATPPPIKPNSGQPSRVPTRPVGTPRPSQTTPARPSSPVARPQRRPSGPPSPEPARPTRNPNVQRPSTGIPARPSPQPSMAPQPPLSSPSMASSSLASGNEEYIIDDLLKMIVEKAGSDLHITVGTPPMLRLQGKLWPTDLPALRAKDTRRLVYQFLTNDQREKFEQNLELDMSYELADVARYRCNIFNTRLGIGAVFRVIPTEIKTLQQLKLPPILSTLAKRNKGLILVTGPTGSGKSTTLAAMVDQVNNERQDHILTVEDPIEFVHKHKSCIVNQREIGVNTKSFANALKAALREDPDIILVGEMRDYETISLAVTAAETGHLVFATLHTPSASQSVDRIVDVFPAHQQDQIRTQLADALQGIIAQQLIPTIDGMSRAVAIEILINTPAVSNLIRDNKTFQLPSIMQTSKQKGMQTMDQSLMDLVKSRKISPQEAYRRAFDKKAFEQYKPREM